MSFVSHSRSPVAEASASKINIESIALQTLQAPRRQDASASERRLETDNEMKDKVDKFNQKMQSLDIRKWTKLQQEENNFLLQVHDGEVNNIMRPSAPRMKGAPEIAGGFNQSEAQSSQQPSAKQSAARADQLERVRSQMKSIDSIYRTYNIKLPCGNPNHRGYLQPFQGVHVEEPQHFKCDSCKLKGEQLCSNDLGFFRCSEAGCKHCICLLCALSEGDSPIFPQLFKLPLCNDLIGPQHRHSSLNNFVCSSIYQKGNQDIPNEWAVCESDIDEYAGEEALTKIQGYEAVQSRFKLCVKCALKWKEFDFKPELDYAKEKAHDAQENLKPIKIKKPSDDNMIFTQPGSEIFKNLSTEYVKEIAKRQITEEFLKIGRYIPQDDDFDQEFLTLDEAFKRDNINLQGKTEILCKQMRFIEYQNSFWPIVQTQETLQNMSGETSFIKTLRIYSNDLKPIKSILLEELPFVPKHSKLFFPSILQYKNSIFYFKRIQLNRKQSRGSILTEAQNMYLDQKDLKVRLDKLTENIRNNSKVEQTISSYPDSDIMKDIHEESPSDASGANERDARDEDGRDYQRLSRPAMNSPKFDDEASPWDYQKAQQQLRNNIISLKQNISIQQEQSTKKPTHLRLFKFDLIKQTEFPILDYGIDETREYLSPFFGKPFGDTFIAYTQKNSLLMGTEIFKEQKMAFKLAEKFMLESSNQGNVRSGYLIVDANSRQAIGFKGHNDRCKQSAIKDGLLLPDEDGQDVNDQGSEYLQPTEALIGYKMLSEGEANFFKRRFVVLQRYQSKDEMNESRINESGMESRDDKRRSTLVVKFKDNLRSLLDFQNLQDAKDYAPPKPVDYRNAIKVFQLDDIEKPVAHLPTLNKQHQATDIPISTFLFTNEITRSAVNATNENPSQNRIAEYDFIAQLTKKSTMGFQSQSHAQKLQQKLVFVMSDEKLYHYTLEVPGDHWNTADLEEKQEATPRSREKDLKIFDQIVVNDDGVQNIQAIDVDGICLPNQSRALPFKQYLLINYKSQELIPIYPNFNDSDQTVYQDKVTGEEKSISIHQRIKDIAKAVFMKQMGTSSIITSNRENHVDSNHAISVRGSQELKSTLLTFLDKLVVNFEINKDKNSQLKLHLMHTRLTTTLFMIDQAEDSIQCVTYKNTNHLGQIIMAVEDSQHVRELPISASQTNHATICNLQRILLEQAINLRYQTLYINSTYQNAVCSESEIFLYEERQDPTMIRCSIKQPKNNNIVVEMPNSEGIYSKLKLQDDDVAMSLKYVTRCRSQHHYLFVFKNNGIPIFIRKTHAEVDDLLARQQAIIQQDTEIMFFTKMDEDRQLSLDTKCKYIKDFANIKKSEKEKMFNNYQVHFEPVIDMRYENPFIVMLYTDQTGCDQQTLVFFNFEQQYIKQECVEPTNENKKDLYAQDVAIVRTSDRIQSREQPDVYFTKYQYIYAYDRQGDRFQFHTVTLIEREHSAAQSTGLSQKLAKSLSSSNSTSSAYGPAGPTEDHVEIQISGMTEMIPSAKQREQFQCAYFKAIPLYGDGGLTLKGMQLIINNNMDNSDGHMIINFIDQAFESSQYKYETELMKFDINKIFCDNEDQSRYYLLAKSSIKMKHIIERRFNDFEVNYLLETMISSLFHMAPFDFARMILEQQKHGLDASQEMMTPRTFKDFFQGQEVLAGKSLCDLHLKNPNHINLALLALKHENDDDGERDRGAASSSIIAQHVEDLPSAHKQRLIESNFLKPKQYLVMDFNFISQIQRAFDIAQMKSAEMLIAHVFNTNQRAEQNIQPGRSEHHTNLIMTVLPQMLSSGKLDSHFQKFFQMPRDDNQHMCKLESKIQDKRVPLFSDLNREYLRINSLKDCRNSEHEIIETLEKRHVNKMKKKEEELKQHIEGDKKKQKEKKESNSFNFQKATADDGLDKHIVKKLYDVEHSFIDFRHLILGQKMNILHKPPHRKGQKHEEAETLFDDQVVFDDYYLSGLIATASSQSLYAEPSIRRIIDYQFGYTRPRWKILLIIYCCCFYIPFVGTLFGRPTRPKADDAVGMTLYIEQMASFTKIEVPIFILGIMTQAIFFAIELVQLRFRWRTYLQESFWNWIEFSQFFVYIGYALEELYLRRGRESGAAAGEAAALADSVVGPATRLLKTVGKSSSTQTSAHVATIVDVEPFNVTILILIIAVGGFAKILYFIRIFKDYGFIVQMVGETITELIPFSVYFVMWILLFTVLFQTLQVEVPDDAYPDLSPLFRYVLQTYGNSIGNIAAPVYKSWTTSMADEAAPLVQVQKHVIIALIWFVWLFNQFLNLIIMLNFLIAVISQVYEAVVSNQEQLNYKHKAELNHEFFMLRKFGRQTQEYRILVFSLDKDETHQAADEWLDFVEAVKAFTLQQNQHLQSKVDKLQAAVDNESATQRSFQSEVQRMLTWQADRIKHNQRSMTEVQQQLQEMNYSLVQQQNHAQGKRIQSLIALELKEGANQSQREPEIFQ